MRYDLAVIGSGSAAFAAAITARDAGASVVMIERGTVGGTCVNTGCVPSKALLAAGAARHGAAGQRFPGIATQAGPVGMAAPTGGQEQPGPGERAKQDTGPAAHHQWEGNAAAFPAVGGEARARSGPVKPAGGPGGGGASGQILVAGGRRRVTAGLNLDVIGVKTGGRGEIVTDELGRTANPRIWAAGDVTGGPQFVYTAAAQGSAAAANALQNAGRTLDYAALPRVTFTSPAIASAALTQAELIRQPVPSPCRVLPLSAVPRAIVARDTRGGGKLVAEAGTGRVRGAHPRDKGAGEEM